MSTAEFPTNIYINKGSHQFCGFRIKDYYSSSSPLSPINSRHPIRILLVRPSSLGDVLFVHPVAKLIKEQFPFAEIYIHTKFPQLFYHSLYVAGFVTGDIDKQKWDKVFYMSYEFTPHIHPIKSYARICGIHTENYNLFMSITTEDIYKADKILTIATKKEPILIHAECDWETRRWSKNNWETLVEMLRCKFPDHDVLSVCHREQHIKGTIDLSGQTKDLRTLIGLIHRSRFMITIDSGVMHLGVSLNKRVYSLFGITTAQLRLPVNYLKWAIQSPHCFSNSHHNREIPADLESRDKIHARECMNAITPKMVFKKITENLDDSHDSIP